MGLANAIQLGSFSNASPDEGFAQFSRHYTSAYDLETILFKQDFKGYSEKLSHRNTSYQGEAEENSSAMPQAIRENFQLLKSAGFSDTLKKRIYFLSGSRQGWYGGVGLSLNPLSLRKFIDFWALIKASSKEPHLFLCQNGNIQAEWFHSPTKNLSIEFKPNSIICVLFDKKDVFQGNISELESFGNMLLTSKSAPLKW